MEYNMNNTLASFIVPVYNIEENYLKECIESLINIKRSNIEIILIDDGSLNECGIICDEYAELDSRVVSVHQVNFGVSEARNKGISLSKGKYVTFIDADDWIDYLKMEKILNYLDQNNFDVLIYGQFIDFKDHSIVIRPFNNNHYFNQKDDNIKLRKMVFVREYDTMKTFPGAGAICNAVDKFINKDIIIKNGIRLNKQIKMGEDNLFYLNLFYYCEKVFYLDICAYHYRMRLTSANNTNRIIGYSDLIAFVDEAKKILIEQKASSELFRALDYRCYDLINEQFYRSYLVFFNSLKEVFTLSTLFSIDMKHPYIRDAIANIKLADYKLIDMIKLLLLKNNLYRIFFFILFVKRKLVSSNGRKEKYY